MRDWDKRSLEIPIKLEYDKKYDDDHFYGKFVYAPLEKGYGVTLGNALRRVLLSSLRGSAVSAIKVEGAQHEFSTVTGVVEDITHIILNIKEVKFNYHEDRPLFLSLVVDGYPDKERVVRASDIELPGQVTIMNPNHKIATLAPEGKLNIEMFLTMGKGYVPADESKANDNLFDDTFIAIDSVYSPIKKVNFSVRNARKGTKTDYDKLIMEVWTDGSILPVDAIGKSAKVLVEFINPFINFEDDESDDVVLDLNVEDIKETGVNEAVYRHLDELELSFRSANCLKKANIRYIGELVQKSETELLKIKNFGRKSLMEIREIVDDLDLELGKDYGFKIEDAEKFKK